MIDEAQRQALIQAAITVSQNAYAPYSQYYVGTALLTDSGEIITGCNVENVSYGLTICAERTALFKAVSEKAGEIVAIAIVSKSGGSPCGACRQVMLELAPDAEVYMTDFEQSHVEMTTVKALLPGAFGI